MKSVLGPLVVAVALNLGFADGRSGEASALEVGELAKVAAFGRCKRDGSVSIQLDRYRFTVPRNILQSVTLSNGQVDRRWPCEDVQLEAQSFFISVTRTHAGDSFYESWLREQRLPVHIEVVKRGRIKNYTSDHLDAAKRRSEARTRDQSGYKVVVSGPDEFFDASGLGLHGFDEQKIVIQCVNIRLLKGGRKCRTSYRFDDAIDVVYEFDDSRFPQAEWIRLDARLRRFVKDLMVHN
jgi:hypothetical protein